jgi:hypothetical protein
MAVSVAGALLSNPNEDELAVGSWFRLSFKREEFLRHIDQLIADGVEAMAPTRRGRPHGTRRREE